MRPPLEVGEDNSTRNRSRVRPAVTQALVWRKFAQIIPEIGPDFSPPCSINGEFLGRIVSPRTDLE